MRSGSLQSSSQFAQVQSYYRRARSSALIQNAAWLFAGQGLSVIVQTLYFVVLARLLSTSQYGVLAGAVALISVVSQYSALGAGTLMIRYVSCDHSRFRAYWGNILLSTFVAGGTLIVLLWLAGPWLIRRENLPILMAVAVGECLFQQLAISAGLVFQAFEEMKVSATLTILTNLLRLGVAIGLLFAFGRASAMQWAYASLFVSVFAASIAVGTVTRRFGLPSFSLRLWWRHSGEGFVFAISGSTTAVYNDVDKVILSHFGMDHANGIYSMAYRIVNVGTLPVMSLVTAAFPRFFREGIHGIQAVLPMARSLARRTVVVALVSAGGMFLIAPLIPRVVGPSYSGSVSALRWLCLIPVLRCFHLSAGDAISGIGDQKFRLFCQSVAAGGNLLLNLYLIPRYSWLGAAWASLATDAGLGMMNWATLFYLKRSVQVVERAGCPEGIR
jgi:O-antigen/teichoic acid export membrane protein